MIYVTDDHADSAEYLVRLLRKSGYTAMTFSCGADLLKQMANERPDLVICDMMMPEMNGIACVESIRNNPSISDVPVILYTADFRYETAEAARKAGANEVVVKGTTKWIDFQKIISKFAGDPPQ